MYRPKKYKKPSVTCTLPNHHTNKINSNPPVQNTHKHINPNSQSILNNHTSYKQQQKTTQIKQTHTNKHTKIHQHKNNTKFFNFLNIVTVIYVLFLIVPVSRAQEIVKLDDSDYAVLEKILQSTNENAVYTGFFVDEEKQENIKVLDWITSKEGEIHINLQKQFTVQQYNQQQQYPNNNGNKYNKFDLFVDIHQSKSSQNYTKSKHIKRQQQQTLNQPIPLQNLQQLQYKYSVQFLLLNPKYITQQMLAINFDVLPSKFIIKQQDNNNIANQFSEYHNQEYGNTTIQKCKLLSPYSWQCNNTLINYTRYWRRSPIQEDSSDNLNILRVNYYMKIMPSAQDISSGATVYNFKQYQIQFTIKQSFTQQQINTDENIQQIDSITTKLNISSKNPLIFRNRIVQLSFYCLFITTMIMLQLISARIVNMKLTQNHAMASKLSLFVLSFCTIMDLSSTIDLAYRIFDTENIYYRIVLFLPALASAILYFGFDVQVLTRVLITQFNQRAFNVGFQNASFKKILIAFYLAFFLSYEGYVLLKAFFQYQWWFILTTNLLILTPQIVRNVRAGNGGDGGFNYWYILGFLVTRNLILIYEHGCPDNYLKIMPHTWLAIMLCIIVVLQVIMLYCQSRFSARFFIPEFLRPGYYKYSHKIKMEENSHINELQCTICLQKIVPQDQDQQSRKQQYKNRTNMNQSVAISESLKEQILPKSKNNKKQKTHIQVYKTPCSHIFHEDCLKSWMRVKLQCPTCRTKLPVL